jgi:hypothetical protein
MNYLDYISLNKQQTKNVLKVCVAISVSCAEYSGLELGSETGYTDYEFS